MALALGCGVAELGNRLDLQEYLDWEAYYEAEPWGDRRADDRQAVLIAYLLSPWLPKGTKHPRLEYPYFDELEPIDSKAAQQAADEWAERWKAWEAERHGRQGNC